MQLNNSIISAAYDTANLHKFGIIAVSYMMFCKSGGISLLGGWWLFVCGAYVSHCLMWLGVGAQQCSQSMQSCHKQVFTSSEFNQHVIADGMQLFGGNVTILIVGEVFCLSAVCGWVGAHISAMSQDGMQWAESPLDDEGNPKTTNMYFSYPDESKHVCILG